MKSTEPQPPQAEAAAAKYEPTDEDKAAVLRAYRVFRWCNGPYRAMREVAIGEAEHLALHEVITQDGGARQLAARRYKYARDAALAIFARGYEQNHRYWQTGKLSGGAA